MKQAASGCLSYEQYGHHQLQEKLECCKVLERLLLVLLVVVLQLISIKFQSNANFFKILLFASIN